MFKKSISVVLPAYNEEGNIYYVVRDIFDTLPDIFDDFEVIIVDDGSGDRTTEIIRDLSEKNRNIKIIRHANNRGYGVALTSGIRASEKDLVFIMDADRQFDISEINKLLTHIGNFDIVAGFRIKRMDSFYRYILGRCFNFIIRILFKIKLRDIDCGFKLYKKELLQKMKLTVEGSLISTEIMFLAYKNNAKIKEVGVNHYPRVSGLSKGASLKVIAKAIFELLDFYITTR